MSSKNSAPLAGRVEVDETFFGGPKPGIAGRGALGKVLVAGAIEIDDHGWGRARLSTIPDASAKSLSTFIRANITVGATVVTDAWRSYPSALKGYVHEPIDVTATGLPAHESLPAVHRLFAQVKRMVEGTYQGSGEPRAPAGVPRRVRVPLQPPACQTSWSGVHAVAATLRGRATHDVPQPCPRAPEPRPRAPAV